MKSLFTLLFLAIMHTACSQSNSISFLEGTWKVEHKEQYEVWETTENETLEGYAYKIKNEQKITTETLSIAKEKNNVIYKATVPNQNNGATIAFTLNKAIDDALSFENLSHDFPKKIIYKKLSDTEILVSVLGENDKGFSYKLIKQ